jgi:hypothetical protein
MGLEKKCSQKLVNLEYRKLIKKVIRIQLNTKSLVKREQHLSLSNLNLKKGENPNRTSLDRT